MIKKLLATLAVMAATTGILAGPAQAQGGSSLDTATASIGRPQVTAQDKATKGVSGAKGNPAVRPPVSRSLTTCPGSPAKCYSYVSSSQSVANVGVAGTFEVASPYLKSTDYHTLAEEAVLRNDPGGLRQIVELGWTKDLGVCGSSTPCLFIFKWKDSVPGCYNGCGWVDYAPNTTVYAGMPLTAGQQMAYRITYDASTPAGGAWWFWVDPDAGGAIAGNWIGYFPQSAWSGLATPFTAGDQIQLFFELAHSVVESCSDMGNGYQGSGGAGASPRPSFIASASYGTATGVYANATLGYGTIPSGSAQWTYNAPSVRTFYGGGPGWNSTGTATGTTGSC